MIDKVKVLMNIGGHKTLDVIDTPDVDCTQQIRGRIEYFLSMAGVQDTLSIEVLECDD